MGWLSRRIKKGGVAVSDRYALYQHGWNTDAETLVICYGIVSRVAAPLAPDYALFRPIRIHQHGRVPGDFRKGAPGRGDHRRSAGHGLEDRKAEPFVEGWKDEGLRRAVEQRQIVVRDVAEKSDDPFELEGPHLLRQAPHGPPLVPHHDEAQVARPPPGSLEAGDRVEQAAYEPQTDPGDYQAGPALGSPRSFGSFEPEMEPLPADRAQMGNPLREE